MGNKSPRKIGGATEKVEKSKEFDYCWKILSFNLSEMENVAHKEKLDGSASTSAYRFLQSTPAALNKLYLHSF